VPAAPSAFRAAAVEPRNRAYQAIWSHARKSSRVIALTIAEWSVNYMSRQQLKGGDPVSHCFTNGPGLSALKKARLAMV
jgi:hypothetical protein